MTIRRTIRGIRDRIPKGYLLGRASDGDGPVELIHASGFIQNYGKLVSPGGGGSGDVTGPGSSTDGDVATFSGATGKIIQDSGKSFDTDGTLAADSDAKIATQKAVKTYVDAATTGAGDVSGPASSTDNAVARFDGTTGKLIQDSGVTIDDSGNLTANNFSGTSSGTNTGDQTIPSAANPSATASDTAVNGTAATFMRSDAAPAVQKASASQFGVVKVDGTTITATSGVISAVAGSGGALLPMVNGDLPGPSFMATPDGQCIGAPV